MTEDRFDERITTALREGTKEITHEKEQIFSRIMEQIENIERDEAKKLKRKRIPKVAGLIIIAFITITVLGFNTKTGKAAIGKIREFFAPEKKVEQELEGNKEEVDLELQEKVDYIIYVDKDMYKMETDGAVDKILPKETFIQNLPEISMTIEQRANEKPEKIADKLMESLASKFVKLEKLSVDKPYPAILVFGHGGSNWDSVIQKYYLVDNTKGGTFVITQTYFLEAEEGHGARFEHMYKEFKIVPSE